MRLPLKPVPLILGACLIVSGEDPTWKNKPIQQWNHADAQAILTYSPWTERVTPQYVRDLSPDERRQSGDMQADQGKGVGLDGLVGILDPGRAAAAIARAHEKPDPGTFLVRWESARPIRAALQLSPDSDAPAVDSDSYYAVVVYDFPTPKSWSDRILKGVAFLKRHDKKDIKPVRVIVQRKDDDLATLVYLFPRSVEISKKDVSVIFQAQIGRLVVTKIFSIDEMQIENQLEL
jgi:hypothetical protein